MLDPDAPVFNRPPTTSLNIIKNWLCGHDTSYTNELLFIELDTP